MHQTGQEMIIKLVISMKSEITYNQIAHLNASLGDQNLPYRIHYVNQQLAGIEGMSSCACEGKEGILHHAIEEFFNQEDTKVSFSEDGYTFSPRLR